MSNYLELLERSYEIECREYGDMSRMEFLGDCVFEYITYAPGVTEFLAKKTLDVCLAISNKTTFDYINISDEDHIWFITIVNMSFFSRKLNWGTSIRGAWWEHCDFELDSTGLYDENEKQIRLLKFTREEWIDFIATMKEFVDV
jgi:hypothetical protein